MPQPALVVAGSACLLLSLALAWALTAVKYLGSRHLDRLFPGTANLLKAHIDYLMMAGLLWAVALLSALLDLRLPLPVVAALVVGSFTNPGGFLVLAVWPTIRRSPRSPFGLGMAASFVVTTFGYGAAAVLLAHAVLAD